MIPTEEWLAQAKRLPVGQARRIQHRFEHRQNMVVRNVQEGWACYCHACGEGGFVPKEFVKVQPQENEPHQQLIPADILPLEQLEQGQRWRVHSFLAQKGMDSVHFGGAVLRYSPSKDRLLVGLRGPDGDAWLGRAVGNQQPKWVAYSTPTVGYPEYAWPGVWGAGPVVITEDPLSAIKVHWAMPGRSVLTSLGTKLPNKLVTALLERGDDVLIWYDGDHAGRAGAEKGAKRLRGLGLNVQWCTVADKDPKDLTAEQIREVVYGNIQG